MSAVRPASPALPSLEGDWCAPHPPASGVQRADSESGVFTPWEAVSGFSALDQRGLGLPCRGPAAGPCPLLGPTRCFLLTPCGGGGSSVATSSGVLPGPRQAPPPTVQTRLKRISPGVKSPGTVPGSEAVTDGLLDPDDVEERTRQAALQGAGAWGRPASQGRPPPPLLPCPTTLSRPRTLQPCPWYQDP